MGANVTFDADTKIMYVTSVPASGVEVSDPTGFYVDLDVKVDFYSDAKEDWITDPYLNQFLFPMSSVGGDELPGEKDLGSTYFLEHGWRIEPYSLDHTFRINGNLYSRDGTSPFIQPPGSYSVMVINTVSNLVDSTVSQLAEIEYTSFGGGVSVDIINGIPGTSYPAGNKEYPCDSIQNAAFIADDRGFDTIYVIGNITLGAGDIITGFIIEGQNAGKTSITVLDAAETNGCEFQECFITGILDGNSIIRNSIISDLNYVNGVIFNSMLNPGTITLGGNTTAHFLDCFSGVPGAGTPTIDFNGGANALAMRSYAGGIALKDKSGSESVSIDLESGQVILQSTVTQGTIVLRGVGKLTDNTTPQDGLDVQADDLINKQNISDAVWEKTSGIQRLIESQKRLPMYGEMFYVDYSVGLSGNDGLTPETPVHSVQFAHDTLIVDDRGDIIFILNNEDDLTIDEQWVFTKCRFSVRGSGWGTTLHPSATTGPTIDIFDNEVSLENFQVRTSATSGASGNQHCISLHPNANLCNFKNMKIKRGIDGGINIDNSNGIEITSCIIEHFGDKEGIRLHGDSRECIFEDNFIYDMKYGIKIEDTASENWLKKNLFHDMYAAVYIVDDTVGHLYIDRDGTFGNLGIELLNPHNLDHVINFRENESEDTAQRAWNVELADHQIDGSTGIQQASQAYGGSIDYNETTGTSGTSYPIGTGATPVNNIPDALALAGKYGLDTLHVHSDATIPSGTTFGNGYIEAHDTYEHTLILESGHNLSNMSFRNLKVTGEIGYNTSFNNCLILDVTDYTGHAIDCKFLGDIHFISPSTHICMFENCSGMRRSGARFHLYDSTQNFQGWTGYIDFHDKTGLQETNVNLNPGFCQVESSCISGSVLVVGEGTVNDLNGGTVVIQSNLLSLDSIATTTTTATWNEQLSGYTDPGSAGDSLANVSSGANPLDIADAVWTHTTSQSLTADVQFITAIEGGRWKIDGTQMIFYAADNTTEVARFDLFDEFGQPNAEAVFQRFRV